MFRMLECKKARREVLDEIEGNEHQGSFLDGHLRNCPSCFQYRKDQILIQEVLPYWTAPEPSPGFVRNTYAAFLRSRTEDQPKILDSRRFFTVPLAAAAGILFLIGIGFFAFFPRQDSSETPTTIFSAELPAMPQQMIASDRDWKLLGIALPERMEGDIPFGL